MLPIKVSGSRMVDSEGRDVTLRGFCVGGWMNMENFIDGYPGQESSFRASVGQMLGKARAAFFFDRLLDNFLGEDDITFMASLGVNALRIPMNYRHFEDDAKPFEYKPKGLARLDGIVKACRNHGIYVILDLHAAQGWQNPDWHADNPAHIAHLWTQKLFQDRVIGLWTHLARHYRNENAIAGYNLLNEPVCPVPGALAGFYRRIVAAVRKVDRSHVLFIEGNWFSTDFSEVQASVDRNTVFSSHNYATPSFAEGPYPGKVGKDRYDRDRLLEDYLRGNAFMRKHRVPTWVGEFGSVYRGTKPDECRLKVVDDQIGIFEEHGHSWTIWTYKDIGMMGTVYARPDSEWMRRTAKVRGYKDRMGTDTWGQRSSVAARTAQFLVEAARKAIGPKSADYGRLMWNANRLIAGIALSEILAAPFAEQFRGMTEKQIDRMMQSFAFRNCAIRNGLADVISKYCL